MTLLILRMGCIPVESIEVCLKVDPKSLWFPYGFPMVYRFIINGHATGTD
jgi:hypothetical protein